MKKPSAARTKQKALQEQFPGGRTFVVRALLNASTLAIADARRMPRDFSRALSSGLGASAGLRAQSGRAICKAGCAE
ncbi:hypothetical protein J2W32_002948 [Variovorax boronicumulans]|nr:hypothetical protein [Variovorax boronicumulans]MDQ0053892.1 hypothetical protein [Variovorax boronicumulans]